MRADRPAASEANVANLLGAVATVVSDGVSAAVAVDSSELAKRTALAVIAKYPGCAIEELRGPLGLSHSGCVRLVDRLVEARLVERQASQDGRAVALHLTRNGRTAASATVACRERALRQLLSILSEAERRHLGAIAAKLLDHAAPTPRAVARTCRLCDYAACEECPFRVRFASSG